ncbi:MAG: ABC transporter ATP-binding protein [Bacteroidota bacterium]
MKHILSLKDLMIGYKQKKEKKVIARDISVDLKKGELVCLLGPNGAGKSTLMRTISGAQKPLGGQVILDNKHIQEYSAKELAKKLSLVLTERVHAGMLTAYEVVALGRYPHLNWTAKFSDRDHELIQWAIEMAGADELAERVLAELSDGERQKIMLARALAQEPELMILDEVTAFLDLPRRVEIMQLLRKLAHDAGKAILLSTHDMDLALRSADRIWLLPKGGNLQVGAPEDLVLNGAFEEAFKSEGVSFDRFSGAFHIEEAQKKPVQLVGEGEAVAWTRRALEREGFSLQDQAALRVEVWEEKDRLRWKLEQKDQLEEFDSIYQLISTIREKLTAEKQRS